MNVSLLITMILSFGGYNQKNTTINSKSVTVMSSSDHIFQYASDENYSMPNVSVFKKTTDLESVFDYSMKKQCHSNPVICQTERLLKLNML